MTKNNEYILSKEKPFETVYELKNETPSFEEFMKTYEGNVNYDDLSGGDVGEVKGYGPSGIGDKRYVMVNGKFRELILDCGGGNCPKTGDHTYECAVIYESDEDLNSKTVVGKRSTQAEIVKSAIKATSEYGGSIKIKTKPDGSVDITYNSGKK